MFTAELQLKIEDGQVAHFNGGKTFLANVVTSLDQRESVDMGRTTLRHPEDAIFLECVSCGWTVMSQFAYCPGCLRTIDYGASQSAVDSYNRMVEEARKRRDER